MTRTWHIIIPSQILITQNKLPKFKLLELLKTIEPTMSTITTSVSLKSNQVKFIHDNSISLSKLVRKRIDELIQKEEGSTFDGGPSSESRLGDSNET